MTLRHEADVSVADWIVRSDDDTDAWARVLQGPPGFEAYATIWFDDDGADVGYRPDDDLVTVVTRLAGAHTSTPDQAWFALWDGWGELSGGRIYSVMDPHRGLGRIFGPVKPRVTPPPFPSAVMDGPRARLADLRDYIVFTGTLADVGDWDARPLAPGWPNDIPQASFTWPADHAWCIASDVDPSWFTVGGSRALVDALLARRDLRVGTTSWGRFAPMPD